MFDLVNDPSSDLYKKLDSRLKAFDEITTWAEPALLGGTEKKIFKDIKVGEAEYFYNEDYFTGKNQTLIHKARYQLILQGQIISVLSDETAGYMMNELKDKRHNRLVNITYQAIRKPFIQKYRGKVDENKWIHIWVEQYNEYLQTYFPKVYPHIAS